MSEPENVRPNEAAAVAAAPPTEPAWLVEATYAPDAAETRAPFRAEHIAGIQKLMRAGIIIAAGAFADVSSSIVILRAADEQAALAVCRADVYLRNGIWVELRARPFGVVREA